MKILDTWKEISTYLNCSIRTAQRYERVNSLPIHRKQGKSKSRVFAYPNELDQWLNQQSRNGNSLKRLKNPLLYIIPLILILIFIGLKIFRFDNNPFSFKIIKSKLEIFNKRGRLLWSHDTGVQNLAPQSSYNSHSNFRRAEYLDRPIVHLPHIIIKDLNSDGKNEVLFSIQTLDDSREGLVLCFDSRGKIKWNYKAGRETGNRKELFFNEYCLSGMIVEDTNQDGLWEIFVIAHHRPSTPSQLSLLSHEGTLQGEYWQCGRLSDYLLTDLNGDGQKELIFVGVNNQYKKGCLLVFDPSHISGKSPQSGDYQWTKPVEGSQLHYLLFPKSNLVDLTGEVRGALAMIDLVENHLISIISAKIQIFFYFDFNFKIQKVKYSDGTRKLINLLNSEKEAQFAGAKKDLERLKKGPLYWTGKDWKKIPEKGLSIQ